MMAHPFAAGSVVCALFLGATVVDEHSLVPIGSAAAILVTVWWFGRKWQKILDTLKEHARMFERSSELFAKLSKLDTERLLNVDRQLLKLDTIEERLGEIERNQKSFHLARRKDLDSLRAELMGKTSANLVGRHYRVLVVDDDVNDRRLMRRMLTQFEVEEASSLAQATEMVANRKYDCVVLDLGLPDSMPGGTVEQFLNAHPSAVCVALSGSDDPNMIAMATQQGADSFMSKNNLDANYASQQIRHAIVRSKERRD